MNINHLLSSGLTSEQLFERAKQRAMGDSAVQYRQVADYIASHFPDQKEAIVQKAEEARQGLLLLPGTENKPFFVGQPPKWTENPVNDNEYVWGLNRMEHWQTLMQAYLLTKQRRYAQQVTSELEHWIDTCPPPPIESAVTNVWERFNSVTPWRSLEAGIRMYCVWPLVFEALFQSELMTLPLFEKMVFSMHQHGEVLEQICPQIWPDATHNHYFMENLGLMCLAGLLPELADAPRWKDHATKELSRCVFNQFTQDGGQIEGCPHYHNLCVKLLRISITLAQRFGWRFSEDYMQRGRNAVSYAIYAQRPSGAIVPWGDSDADGSSFRSAVDGYLMFHDKTWLNILLGQGGAREIRAVLMDYLWELPGIVPLLEDEAFLRFDPALPALPTVQLQRDLNQATLRTGWEREALSVFFACQLPVNNGHAHIDPTGFDFTAYGRPLLVDPGRYCYREDEDRVLFKSAPMHNTVTVNFRPPFEYLSTWDFGPQRPGSITWVKEHPGVLAAQAVQHSFDPVLHSRLIALIDARFLLVVDRFDGMAPPDSVQLYFHIDDTDVTLENHLHLAQGSHIAIRFSDRLAASLQPGMVSDFLDVSRPSTRLCLHDGSSSGPVRVYATLCFPLAGPPPAIDAAPTATALGDGRVVIGIKADGKPSTFVWTDDDFYKLDNE